MPTNRSDRNTGLGLGRILRAVFIGVFLFLLWRHFPIPALRIGVQNSPYANPIEDPSGPVFRDAKGKRITEAEYQAIIGYEKAKREGITSHAQCRSLPKAYEVHGCYNYVIEQKHFPPHIKQGNFGSGKTTEQCRTEVNAYWEPRVQDMRERGDDHAANLTVGKDWMLELRECQNYDAIRIGDVIHKPAMRLRELLAKAGNGGSISEQDRETVLNDLQGVMSFPDHPEKQAYLAQSEYFFQLADGKIKLPEPTPVTLSCPEIKEKLDALAQTERETNAAQAELRRGDGVIIDGPRWDALNKARINRLWEWKRYSDDAKAAGCT